CGLTGFLNVSDDCIATAAYSIVAPAAQNIEVFELDPFQITGTVKDLGGQDVSGFTMILVGSSQTSSTLPTWTSPSPGHYTATVPCGWAGTTVPVKAGLTFNPWSTGKITNVASHDFQAIDILQITSPSGTPDWYPGLPATVSWTVTGGTSNIA